LEQFPLATLSIEKGTAKMAAELLATSEVAAAVRAHASNLGVASDHPALTGHLAGRIRRLLESGALRHTRIRNRYYVDPADVPTAASLLGLSSLHSRT
jgi:hypothetical protein